MGVRTHFFHVNATEDQNRELRQENEDVSGENGHDLDHHQRDYCVEEVVVNGKGAKPVEFCGDYEGSEASSD